MYKFQISFFSSPVQKYRELLLSSLASASAWALAWAFILHFKVLGQSFTLKFLCNGQVAARQAFLYADMSCCSKQ